MGILRSALYAAAGVCAAIGSAAAQPTLGLEEAIAYALDHNPELAAARAQQQAAAEAVASAEGARLPQVDLRYSARRSDNPLDVFAERLNTRSVTSADFDPTRLNDPGASTLHATELSLLWPVYTGGRVQAGVRAARGHELAARHRYRRLRELIAFRTLSAYRQAQAAAEAVRILDDAVHAAKAHADTTARLLAERRIVPSDKLSAEVNLALVQSQREQAVTRARNALEQLALVMGIAPGDPLPTLPPWEEPPADVPIVGEDLVALEHQALAQRADLQALAAEHEAARARIAAARAGFRPQLSVGATRHWYDDTPSLDNASNSLLGVVSLNLYRGGRDRHELAQAQHQAEEAAVELERARHQVLNEVRAATRALEEARTRVAICADNVGKARRAVELVRGRYGEGRTLLLDLLATERVLTESRLEKLNATLALSTAVASLQLAVGTFEPPVVVPAAQPGASRR